MNIPKPSFGHYEINLNTVVMVVGFVVGAITWGITWQTLVGRVDRIDEKFTVEVSRINTERAQRRSETEQRWRDHEQLHKERQAELAARAAKDDERFKQIIESVAKLDQHEYRITVLETGSVNLTKGLEELKTVVNAVAGDLRVTREILQRLDPGPRGTTLNGTPPEYSRPSLQ